ncbi:hypothetical protein GCM10010129_38860 [Streptomyces fumigatiscleroticus]|nr:hypothetical protein GCM10010129_38860 [Streptomyces fumigatiscleroticus]
MPIGQDRDTVVIDSDDVTVEVHTGVLTGPAMLPLVGGLAEKACCTGAVAREQTDNGSPSSMRGPGPTGSSWPRRCSWRRRPRPGKARSH